MMDRQTDVWTEVLYQCHTADTDAQLKKRLNLKSPDLRHPGLDMSLSPNEQRSRSHTFKVSECPVKCPQRHPTIDIHQMHDHMLAIRCPDYYDPTPIGQRH